MDRSLFRGFSGFCLLLASPCFAQTISTGDAAASLPVDSPLALAILALLISVLVFKVLHKHRALAACLPLVIAVVAATQSPNLRALAELSFTNPAGETLTIPVVQETSGADIEGFEGADYTNNSGKTLTIRRIVTPTFAQCFPAGADNLLAGSPTFSCFPDCAEGMALADGNTCHMSVERICRDLVPGPELTALNPTAGTASGGTGFTLTGTNLTGTTGVTFDGVAATSVNVVNSTTVTGVTPAHAAGVVNVVLTSGLGSNTLTNGYTYQTTAAGQASGGGTIACLNGGLNNLIAATADISAGIQWSAPGITTNAQSTTDGAANTALIVTALGNNGSAAAACSNYEVDSQGNTPCQVGNSCYNDWFLPAGNNATVLGQLHCLYTNRDTIGGFASGSYWSSTEEATLNPELLALGQSFSTGGISISSKTISYRARCVRAFTP